VKEAKTEHSGRGVRPAYCSGYLPDVANAGNDAKCSPTPFLGPTKTLAATSNVLPAGVGRFESSYVDPFRPFVSGSLGRYL